MKTATISILALCLLFGACHTKPDSTAKKKTATDKTSDHSHGCDHDFVSDSERASKETTLTVNEKWEKITNRKF